MFWQYEKFEQCTLYRRRTSIFHWRLKDILPHTAFQKNSLVNSFGTGKIYFIQVISLKYNSVQIFWIHFHTKLYGKTIRTRFIKQVLVNSGPHF